MSEATFDNGVVRLYQGDARRVLRELSAESVHCVVTSPPYWGLRDYGLEPLVWGGDDHEHEWGEPVTVSDRHSDKGTSTLSGSNANQMAASTFASQGAFCPCGAWRGSLGLEPTIDLYVEHIVEIFREVRRVMRPDATLWCNLGDSYAGSGKGQMADGEHHQEPGTKQGTNAGTLVGGLPTDYVGLKPKDLCMMPARVALALQADGWWLRSDIVWSKPNPMPESVTDRPTRAHEYLFLLTKAERCFYDADAIREADVTRPQRWLSDEGVYRTGGIDGRSSEAQGRNLRKQAGLGAGRNKRSVWEIATEPMGYEWCRGCGMVYTTAKYRQLSAGAARRCTTDLDESGDNKCGGTRWEGLESGRLACMECEVEYPKSAVDKMPRAARCRRCKQDDAWGSHFATFPQKLVEPCILAGTSAKGVCPDCGAPWERVVERRGGTIGQSWHNHENDRARGQRGGDDGHNRAADLYGSYERETTGWRPTCDCGHEGTIPAIVLDPFAGSGTVAYVAQRLGRHSIGIDLSAEYLALAEKRMRGQSLPMSMG